MGCFFVSVITNLFFKISASLTEKDMRKDISFSNILEYSLHALGEHLNLTRSMLIYLGLGEWGVLLPDSPEYHSAHSNDHFWSPGGC